MAFSLSDVASIIPSDRKLQTYSNAYVVIEGRLLTQEASVSIEKVSNSKPRNTLAKGFAGMSLGAGLAEVSVENAVPSKDFEWHPDFFLRTGQAVEVGIAMASRQTLIKGFITSVTYSHAVNDAAKMSFKLTCRLADFE